MTGYEAFMLLPLWARALAGFLVFDVVVILVMASVHANQIAKSAQKLERLQEAALQDLKALNTSANKTAQTLSLILGMQISEKDERQRRENKDATDEVVS